MSGERAQSRVRNLGPDRTTASHIANQLMQVLRTCLSNNSSQDERYNICRVDTDSIDISNHVKLRRDAPVDTEEFAIQQAYDG
jgi:hypothetical protein